MNTRIRTRDVVAGVVADATTDLEKAAGRGGIVSRGAQQQLSLAGDPVSTAALG